MVDIVEIYVHWYTGRSKSQVSASLGVDRKTVRKYLAPAEEAGITPGGPPMSETDWAKLLKRWFPELASRKLYQVRWGEIEPHRDYVKSLLETTTVTAIRQRLRDEGKLKVSLSTFRRWVHENLPDEAARSKVTVLRDDVEPGSEAQIDSWSARSGRRAPSPSRCPPLSGTGPSRRRTSPDRWPEARHERAEVGTRPRLLARPPVRSPLLPTPPPLSQ
ncbi:hypothetical protein [Streptomyces mirabilis]|uniref:hypothetical protein n=1 Tax=Streptomyces mirabilis TaxID=68239 RepID=UPI0036EB1CCC